MDKDGNGEIDKNELRALFADSNVDQVNGKSVDEIIKSCDKDNSGTIDFEEFKLAIMQWSVTKLNISLIMSVNYWFA